MLSLSIYFLENITHDLQEGVEYEYEACLLSPVDDCKVKYNIKIRRCDQDLHYFLTPTDGDSAYCFGKTI